MSREAWSIVKQSKRFYVNTYRKAGTVLLGSVIVNLVLGSAIYYNYINRPQHDFYATSGITPPVKLTYMDEANMTSLPLLASDPGDNDENKVIPK